MDFAKLIDWLKLPTQYFFVVLLFCGLVLGFLMIAPEDVLKALGLRDFRTEYRTWLGLGLIFAAATLLIRGGNSILQLVKRWLTLRRMKGRLHNLTPEERAILVRYLMEQSRTQRLPADDGVVRGLVTAGVIDRSSGINVWFYDADHNLQSWAWDYINKHPGLVEEPEEER